jgi:crotonobetainyl-CoA:carnitine CoA-transferase CaiB-like acyl-CoA transferase
LTAYQHLRRYACRSNWSYASCQQLARRKHARRRRPFLWRLCLRGRGIHTDGAIEPQFYALLLEKAGIADAAFSDQNTMQDWPQLKDRLAQLFLTKTRAEWCALLEGSDAFFAPSWTGTKHRGIPTSRHARLS